MSETDPTDDPDEKSLAERVRSHISENRTGMIQDLAFAITWVTLVSLLYDFAFASAPRWVLYLFMVAGVPAYFGFFVSLEMAKEQR
jgi:hypothetical protein